MMESLKNRRRAAGEGGFTLIELLVVIVILGILAGVVVFAVSGINDKGQKAACQTDTRTLRTAMEANYAAKGSYPTPTPAVTDGAAAATSTAKVDQATLVSNGFLSTTSTMHDIYLYDTDTTTSISPAVAIRISDAQCGTLNALPGSSASNW
jgi:prepilin-type N-terminal cleavage/methylation domain-containing protein